MQVQGGAVSAVDDPAAALATGARLVWTALTDPSPEQLAAAARALALDEGLVADARSDHRRPRLVEHGDARAVVLLPASYDDERESVLVGSVVALVDGRAVLTVARDTATDLAAVRAGLTVDSTPADLLEAVVRRVVDDYDAVVDGLDEDVVSVEQQVFSEGRTSNARRVYLLKRESLELHRAVTPLVEVVRRLGCDGSLVDRLLRVSEHVQRLDALLDGALSADLAQVGVRQNEDQRRISAWAAIGLVPTVVGGIYGMNFEHMPELTWTLGYPAALTVVIGTCSSLYVGFRRSGWL